MPGLTPSFRLSILSPGALLPTSPNPSQPGRTGHYVSVWACSKQSGRHRSAPHCRLVAETDGRTTYCVSSAREGGLLRAHYSPTPHPPPLHIPLPIPSPSPSAGTEHISRSYPAALPTAKAYPGVDATARPYGCVCVSTARALTYAVRIGPKSEKALVRLRPEHRLARRRIRHQRRQSSLP